MAICPNTRCRKEISNRYEQCLVCGFKEQRIMGTNDSEEKMRYLQHQLEEFWAKEDAEREAKLRELSFKIKLYQTKDKLTTYPIEKAIIFNEGASEPIQVVSFEDSVNIDLVITNGLGEVKTEKIVFNYVPKSIVLFLTVKMEGDTVRAFIRNEDGNISIASVNEIKLL